MNVIKSSIGFKSKPMVYPIVNGIEKFKPKINGATDLQDFTIFFDNNKKNCFKTHRVLLEKGN